MICCIFLLALLSLGSSEVFVSSRYDLLMYMKQNNCKNMHLNRVLTKIVNKNTYYKFSYESLYNLINGHFRQFKREDIYKCYEVLTQKYVNERRKNDYAVSFSI